ncbi:uncharacterized protein L3040_006620 [Drepanopeziza brunnea f. sp. 'multigermtubi']|uniref:uncharacterized protein n=1 Tax=Drepanopeziza brunnea f. sp. 'multigermtubi' TaxID=698441 RepID=UPI0023A230E3|nr:hypothetical protein L3040_006620 [Drepanopeziza brunnea f. sp. 'multigermtubi']
MGSNSRKAWVAKQRSNEVKLIDNSAIEFNCVYDALLSGVSSTTCLCLQVPVEHPTLEDLQLESLSPNHWSLRTHIRAEFPTNSSSYGQTSWYLLHNLHEGRRYEVRICWAATQPTSFRLDTFELPTVMETPELIASLAQYSETRQREVNEGQEKDNRADGPVSTLLLRIFAAADYFTTNKTLMDNVPPVYVDIILDPFVFNVFPRSLLPTATYLVLVAVGSCYTWHVKFPTVQVSSAYL